MYLSYLLPIGLICLLMVGCLSPMAITPPPPKPATSAIKSTTTLTMSVVTPSVIATSTTPLVGEADETADKQCNQTPYTTEAPASNFIASFTSTWFRNEESTLWAGLAPLYQGKWYAGPEGLKVLWWRSEGTFREPLQVEGDWFGGKTRSMQAEIPDGYSGNRYQASGLIFPESGCWSVTGKSGDRETTFVIWVNPAEDHPIK